MPIPLWNEIRWPSADTISYAFFCQTTCCFISIVKSQIFKEKVFFKVLSHLFSLKVSNILPCLKNDKNLNYLKYRLPKGTKWFFKLNEIMNQSFFITIKCISRLSILNFCIFENLLTWRLILSSFLFSTILWMASKANS